MRIRDRNYLRAECGMTACCVLVAALACWLQWVVNRRLTARLEDMAERVAASERTVADACAAAVTAHDAARDFIASGASGFAVDAPSTSNVSARVVLGYGQTRSPRRRYLYRDIKEGESVRREYRPLPFSQP